MSKSIDKKKETKKAPTKTIKEKRAAKKAKRKGNVPNLIATSKGKTSRLFTALLCRH